MWNEKCASAFTDTLKQHISADGDRNEEQGHALYAERGYTDRKHFGILSENMDERCRKNKAEKGKNTEHTGSEL